MVLADFDILREAGKSNRALVKEFRGIEVAEDLEIEFIPRTEKKPIISGIEVVTEGW